jgi:hypothetical protein
MHCHAQFEVLKQYAQPKTIMLLGLFVPITADLKEHT